MRLAVRGQHDIRAAGHEDLAGLCPQSPLHEAGFTLLVELGPALRGSLCQQDSNLQFPC